MEIREMNFKPRNHVALALMQFKKKSGSHDKPKKAQRRQDKIDLQKSKQE